MPYKSGSQPFLSHGPLSNNYQAYGSLHFYKQIIWLTTLTFTNACELYMQYC